jgi:RNA polymerase sigma-70 factor (ECF subfamily)
VAAWERADIDALLALLASDARFTMPPLPAWFAGRTDIGRFYRERVFETPWRLQPIRANGQPALACYRYDGERFGRYSVNVLSVRGGEISGIAAFLDPVLHGWFDLPAEFPVAGPMNPAPAVSLYG